MKTEERDISADTNFSDVPEDSRKVSVIIPIYNKGEFILETLASVQAQTYGNIEVIVVDDQSTDNSFELVEGFIKSDDRFKLYSKENGKRNGSASRNFGLVRSTGEFILFLDADDLLIPRCIEIRMQRVYASPNLDFLVWPLGTFYKTIGDSNLLWDNFSGNLVQRYLRHDLAWSTSSVLWNRKFIVSLEGFNEDFDRLQDVEVHTRALMAPNVKFGLYKEDGPTSFYRIDDSRIVYNQYSFLKKWSSGVASYIAHFGDLLAKNGREMEIRNLLGCYFTFLNAVKYRFVNDQISSSEYESLISEMDKKVSELDLFSNRDKKIMQFYKELLNSKVSSVKGVKYLFRKLIARV